MSTREDLLQKYMSSFGFALNDQEFELVRGAYNDGWQAAMESQWISVDDRLPDVGVHVFVYPSEPLPIRYMKKDGDDIVWFFDALPVTHWMPLPQPPKEKL
jgi:hypothetical protein